MTPAVLLNGKSSLSRPRTAIVVEGGGLRGAFCAGVLSTLHRIGIRLPDYLLGTSAGAPSAAFMATGQIENAIRLWENHTHASHLVSFRHLLKGRPLMDIDKLVSTFKAPDPLDVCTLEDGPSQVFIAATHCITGQAEYLRLRKHNAFEVLTATMALPGAYGKVVRVDGHPYIDGGASASIPLQPALVSEIENILVILTRPPGYRKKTSQGRGTVYKLQYPQYPEAVRALIERGTNYNRELETVERLEAEGRLTVIRPQAPLPASRMTRNRNLILDTIQVGREQAQVWFPQHGSRFA